MKARHQRCGSPSSSLPASAPPPPRSSPGPTNGNGHSAAIAGGAAAGGCFLTLFAAALLFTTDGRRPAAEQPTYESLSESRLASTPCLAHRRGVRDDLVEQPDAGLVVGGYCKAAITTIAMMPRSARWSRIWLGPSTAVLSVISSCRAAAVGRCDRGPRRLGSRAGSATCCGEIDRGQEPVACGVRGAAVVAG